jgi:hypothetical protein
MRATRDGNLVIYQNSTTRVILAELKRPQASD